MHRIYLAFLCFFRILFGKPLPAEVLPAQALPEPAKPALPPPEKKPAEKAKPADPSAGALQLLALFQREGRLVDFLNEGIDAFDDASIGAAVREIHKGCKKVLHEHFRVEPVIEGDENEPYTVDSGFDARRIRVTGNVAGKPPWKGVLKHHGWQVAKVTMPSVTDGIDPSIVAPAEVELP